MTSNGTLRPAADDSAASWITERIGPFGAGIRGLLPPVFEGYTRILHPAWTADRKPVRWATVAAWSGGTADALAQFEPMARQREQTPVPGPFHAPPTSGALPPAMVVALCDVLAHYTTTPDRCSFELWEGYGWIAWMAPERRRAAKLGLPNRTYLLFEGPLGSVADLGWPETPSEALDRRSVGLVERARSLVRPTAIGTQNHRSRTSSNAALERESPNLIWPADRTWFVASEIDLDSTFVGGSTELIDGLIGDSRFEAWRASPDDPVTADSDLLNTHVR